MSDDIRKFLETLSKNIESSYEESVTMEEAEKLASKFLSGQIKISDELKRADLDARMRKSGLKAIRSAVYMKSATSGDKKPSDTFLEAIVNMDELVIGEQGRLDEAEVELDYLQNHYNIFKEAHIHFRGISRGRFE